MYKAIISDFDGTLATCDKRVTEENFEAINKLIKRGKKFALCTGRMTASAMMLVEKLPIKPLIATYNGSEIVNSQTGERLIRHSLESNLMLEIITYARSRGLYFQIFDDEVIVEKITEVTDFYCSICKVKARAVGDLYSYISERKATSPKLMLINFRGEVESYIAEVMQLFGDKVEAVRCYDGMIDITPKGINKGSAVTDFCKIWGIDESECIGIGDEGNDIAMFETAGLGVAMINARDEVKKEADLVTEKDNDNSGVAEIINKFML
ncbi:MAG: HAD family phosphatase [Clostridiales bacterium]|nr:HAD family phosphatase [Clostridiales bacterium]